jgi:hypothetical protein
VPRLSNGKEKIMRVSVLAVLPSQETLKASATASLARQAPSSLRQVAIPKVLEIDPGFAAVPVGPADRPDAPAAAFQPEASERFAVRAYIEVEDVAAIPAMIDGVEIHSDPVIAPFLTCGGTAPVGGAADIATKLNVAALRARGLDGAGVALAIMDTGINLQYLAGKLGTMPQLDVANSWRNPAGPVQPGMHPVDHGTMCAFDALIAAPKATLIDFPILAAKAPGGALSGSTLSVAIQAYAQLLSSWAVAYAPGGLHKYTALVVSNSWGMFHPSWDFPAGHPGRYIDNPNHPFMQMLNSLATHGVDIVFAAGNCGAQCPDGRCQALTTGTITGASASPDVLTLGDATRTTAAWDIPRRVRRSRRCSRANRT